MRTYRECLPCFERQAREACEMSAFSPEDIRAFMMGFVAEIESFRSDAPPIELAAHLHDLVRESSGQTDPYAEAKSQANRVCRECVPLLQQSMSCSVDSLATAVKLAIAGNIIDCGAYGMKKVSKDGLTDFVREVMSSPLQGNSLDELKSLIRSAGRILYIGDNAGECFFDVPLLKLIPSERLTYAVRGGPILNDATLEDARAAGIDKICPVIDTGDNAPGILLDRCSEEFRRDFEQSDLIISKGQGNYESLSNFSGKVIVFLTKVKCAVIAEDIGCELGSSVMKINSEAAK